MNQPVRWIVEDHPERALGRLGGLRVTQGPERLDGDGGGAWSRAAAHTSAQEAASMLCLRREGV